MRDLDASEIIGMIKEHVVFEINSYSKAQIDAMKAELEGSISILSQQVERKANTVDLIEMYDKKLDRAVYEVDIPREEIEKLYI